MSTSIERVVSHAADHGVDVDVVEFPEATKTAAEAAAALGCDVAQIVKSLVFQIGEEFVVALVPGDRRLDTERLAHEAGGVGRVSRAAIDDVRGATGFVAGGTPPFGHSRRLRVFADVGLRRTPTVWAAAGTPHTVFEISHEDLDHVAGPQWGEISEP